MPATPATESCKARSWVEAGSISAQLQAAMQSMLSPSVRRPPADAASASPAPMPARTAGQGAPSRKTSAATAGKAAADAMAAERARAAQGVRSQMRFATQRTSSATTARCRPALDKRCTRPLAERSSSVSGGSSERSPAPSAATSPARPGVVHTSAQRRTNRARRSATSCQARGAGESSSRPSPEPW